MLMDQLAALDDLATMLEECAATPGSCLWFAGDESSCHVRRVSV
ncbi:hypothetical protein Y717_12270 [Streptomyces scopuliridis RB72]|uniref:Uncharacterized protein n=1 Tax=Streptomyces scopuliridis RB72 TaxID=1440053 RepID=A0A2T7SN64_9ACTN|nr:hypothetical protein Y717_12270 [Streptomyces scopuliridis RB72]